MIIRWKMVGATEYVAVWQSKSLSIRYTVESRWRVYVDEERVKGVWFTPQAAMEAVDVAACKVIKALGRSVQAAQRAYAMRKAVVHA